MCEIDAFTKHIFSTGFPLKIMSQWEAFRKARIAQKEIEVPGMPGTKLFTPKCNLPKLINYRGEPSTDYWENWPSISWDKARHMKSAINPVVFERLAVETNYPYPSILQEVISDIKNGAMIGVADQYRIQSRSTNAPSA